MAHFLQPNRRTTQSDLRRELFPQGQFGTDTNFPTASAAFSTIFTISKSAVLSAKLDKLQVSRNKCVELALLLTSIAKDMANFLTKS